MGVSPSHVFKNGGLVLTIISRLPDEIITNTYEKDKDYYELQVAAKATGIYERLKEAGKKYHALSPRWTDENKKDVAFWLNPWGQDKYNFGWYTVQDLDDWIADEGKIIKTENQKR